MDAAEVDVFLSHSWAAERWRKYLGVCFFLNFSLAVQLGSNLLVSPLGSGKSRNTKHRFKVGLGGLGGGGWGGTAGRAPQLSQSPGGW